MKKTTIIEAISYLLILLFGYAAISKLVDYENFTIQLSKSPYISFFAPLLAWGLPVVELLVAAVMIFPKSKRTGLYGSLFLMTLFTAYIFSMLHFSYYIPCACGGIFAKLDWVAHLFVNIGIMILNLVALALYPTQGTPVERRKAIIFPPTATMSVAVLVVVFLTALARNPFDHKNGFIRRFRPEMVIIEHVIPKDGEEEIAGVAKAHLYFKTKAPNLLIVTNRELGNARVIHLPFPSDKRMASLFTASVDSPYVHVFANNVPAVIAMRLDTAGIRFSLFPYLQLFERSRFLPRRMYSGEWIRLIKVWTNNSSNGARQIAACLVNIVSVQSSMTEGFRQMDYCIMIRLPGSWYIPFFL
jgi:hypothetical protein